MPSDRQKRAFKIFGQALDLPTIEREVFVDSACRDQPELKAEVGQLLESDKAARESDFLRTSLFNIESILEGHLFNAQHEETFEVAQPQGSRPAIADALDASAPSSPPNEIKIPGYRIVREIGGGGQGVVYEAVQLSTRRTIAIKLLRYGTFLEKNAQLRFEREVQLIASLQHPNIIVVHDGGVTNGVHYFAMDYVQGRPLDQYVRAANLAVTEIVRLFRQVCEGLAYAHRRGVIHRDLKPSNILVRKDGVPIVLDFGLAKVTGEGLERSVEDAVSVTGQVMGTWQYMSPEHTLGVPDGIDTRSDVYSLGVILFQLLTQTTPYDTNSRDVMAVMRTIREIDPPRPSKLRSGVNSEIESIVLKAMEKDPNRRYQSAADLAEELGAWLDGRPVTAKSASSLYLIRKLAARNKFAAIVVGMVAAIVLGSGGIVAQALWAMWTAKAEVAEIDAAVTSNNQALLDGAERQRAFNRKQALIWFLLEWNGGRFESAIAIHGDMAPDTSESEAMSFLLDPSYQMEDFLQKLGPGESELGYFVAGEKLAHSAQKDAAATHYQRSVESPGEDWKKLAQARLDQLRGRGMAVPMQ